MVDDVGDFVREKVRVGRLPLSTKFYQAIGGLPDALKGWAFSTFLLLYYNQVLGFPATWVALVLAVSLLIDAVVDPIVGSHSDGMRSRLGRRHLLMYAAILPLGASLFLLFSPPEGMPDFLLVAWLAAFAILTRIAMTFYLIPWSALFPELSDDYAERSEILTWRYLVGGIGAILFTVAVWTFIFPSQEGAVAGQLNAAAYPPFAGVLSLAVVFSAFLTTYLTQREIPYLRQPTTMHHFSLPGGVRDLLGTLRNRDFMLLFAGLLISATISGTLEALGIYMSTYFWGFLPEDLRWFAVGGVGGLVAFALIPTLQRLADKQFLLLVCMTISLIDGLGIILLRFLDVLPENGSPLLLLILVANEILRIFLGVIIAVMFISMIADSIDAQELATGQRQEGVFSAAIAFSNKAISGFGILAAGFILDLAVRLPANALPGDVTGDVLGRLGITIMTISLLYLIPFWIASKYTISRDRHAAIVRELAA